jgi:hypothetical protein
MKNDLKKNRFIWAYGFKVFSPWSAGSIAFRPVVRQKSEEGKAW